MNFDLSGLDGTNGFAIEGLDGADQFGRSVSNIGDVNGDGIDDIIIGAPSADPGDPQRRSAGESYVIFGSTDGFSGTLDLADLDGTNGFVVNGVDGSDFSGISVAGAGDINGDGIADFLIGATGADNGVRDEGETYVVFGRSDGFGATLELSALNGTNGFTLAGSLELERSGLSVSRAGDVNGDGLDDLLVGAYGGGGSGGFDRGPGETYVVFGSTDSFASRIVLSSVDGTDGFVLNGVDDDDQSGRSVANAGDVNGDGIDDIIIGAPEASPGLDSAGETYVVFGSTDGFGASFDLSSLDGTNGFVVTGGAEFDRSGAAVAGAGDVNGDGIDDVIIGAPSATGPGAFSGGPGARYGGEVYVIFGSTSGFSASIGVGSLDGSNGFTLIGNEENGRAGTSVAGAGDVNGDGIDDILVGAPSYYGFSSPTQGEAYVIFGTADGFASSMNLSDLDGTDGFIVPGEAAGQELGASVSAAGDVNGDGAADLIIGASGLGPPSFDPIYAPPALPGSAFVIFGLLAPDPFVVTTLSDVVAYDGEISLREAVAEANRTEGAQEITFAEGLTGLLRPTQGEIEITDAVTIDGAGQVTITGDANGDDITEAGTDITDVAASLEVPGVLEDNSRIFHISADLGDTSIRGLTLTGGRAAGDYAEGGAIKAEFTPSSDFQFTSGTTLNITGSTIRGNLAAGSEYSVGGGVYASIALISDSDISGNFSIGASEKGAGVAAVVAYSITLMNSTVTNNSAIGVGAGSSGAISAERVTAIQSVISDNVNELGFGGGITTNYLTLVASSVTHNTALSAPGLLANTAEILNSTVSGNSATAEVGNGGGLVLFGGGTISNSTFTGNSVAGISDDPLANAGVGIYAVGDELTISNSIIQGNVSVSSESSDVFKVLDPEDSLILAGSNIIGGDIFDGDTDVGDVTADQVFAQTFDNNGVLAGVLGPDGTVALLPGGAAVDAGDASALPADTFDLDDDGDTIEPLPLDALGEARIIGAAPDLGAVEAPDPFLVTTLLDVVDADDGEISLREAVAAANTTGGAQEITFVEGLTGLLRLTQGEIEITDAVTIDGAGQITITGDANGNDVTETGTDITNVAVSLNGQDLLADNSRIFDASYTFGDVTVEGLTLTGGRTTFSSDSGGAIAGPIGALNIYGSILQGNSTAGSYAAGGAVSVGIGGTLTIADTMVLANATSGVGAAGGGINFASTGDFRLLNSVVDNNSTIGDRAAGSGVFAIANSVRVVDSQISNNYSSGAQASGGGIHVTGDFELVGSIVSNNSTAGRHGGGGVYTLAGSALIQNSIISYNTSTHEQGNGGGLNARSLSVDIVNSSIHNNSASGEFARGGGVYGNEVRLLSSTMAGNSSAFSGGGIVSQFGLSAINSTISDNSTAGYFARGGGVYSFGAATFTNSTISGNSTEGDLAPGGGIFSFGVTTVTNSTISGNSTAGLSAEGGGIYSASALILVNSIVLGNVSSQTAENEVFESGSVFDNDGVPEFRGFNIVGADTTAFDASGVPNVINADPDNVFASVLNGAGVLGDNGGPVQTIALLQGGSAIDQGDPVFLPVDTFDLDDDGDTIEPLPLDATGAARIDGATVDLGAVEGALVLLQGSPDPDDLQGSDLSETIIALESDDTVVAGGGRDLVDLGLGDDSADGGEGVDTLSFATLAEPSFVVGEALFGVFANLSTQGTAQNTGAGLDTFTGFENLEGSQFGDLLTGDGGANTLTGLGGGDVLNGGDGDDVLLGGEGFDAIEGGAGADQLFGGTGGAAVEGDIATYFSATGPLVFDFGATTSEIQAGSSAEVLEDTIGADIEGVAGAGGHSSTFLGDELTGLTFFLGGSEADTFVGGSGVDQLIGLGGDDVMYGNDGVDALIGEGGDDDLFGGAGSDVFFFDGVDGNDTIHDLELGIDLIFFTGGNLVRADVTFADTDADGNGVTDALLTYEVLTTNGLEASSITVIDHDAQAVEAQASLVFT